MAIDFLRKLLTPDPDQRPSASSALQDVWLAERGKPTELETMVAREVDIPPSLERAAAAISRI
jgi:serine/threonine protein kinase